MSQATETILQAMNRRNREYRARKSSNPIPRKGQSVKPLGKLLLAKLSIKQVRNLLRLLHAGIRGEEPPEIEE